MSNSRTVERNTVSFALNAILCFAFNVPQRITGRPPAPPVWRRLNLLVGFLLILLLPGSLAAQMGSQFGSLTGGSQSSGQQSSSSNCSDPLLAGSSLCSMSGSQQPSFGSGFPSAISAQPRVSNFTDVTPASQSATPPPFVKLPPQPLTEFQKFVASTTGQVLPIFGADLFANVPTTFSPLNMTPVPRNYVIGPGDELRIRVWGQVNFSVDESVDRSGEIYLPQVGEVHVLGLTFSQLKAHLSHAIRQVYRNFSLTVDLGRIRSIQVYVTGEARRPGVYTVSSLSTLADAIFASGGPSVSGSMRDIQLRRNGRTVTNFDLYSLLIDGSRKGDAPLQPGDIIYIPPVGPQIALTGSVQKPAIYELRPGETLSEAIADAGGPTAVASETRVSIERVNNHRARYAMNVNWDATGLATPLQNGDLVRLYSILPLYQKTVTLRGNVANPGRFAWHPGMRLSDLIPDRASLVTRNYWWKRAELGLPVPEFQPLEWFTHLHQPINPVDLPRNDFFRTPPPVPAAGVKGNAKSATRTGNSGNSSSANSNNGLGNAATLADQGQAAGATNPASVTPTAAQRANSASLAGEYDASQFGKSQPRTTVGPVAPDIDWSYAVIERLDPKTLKTHLVPFDLGKLVMQHDPSQNLLLQPGDVVTIFSQADIKVPRSQETKFVRLEGEFVHSGVYTVRPDETLRELVRQAGGLTPGAYLYGSQFTRESTRVLQQQRMDEYVQQLQMQMQRGMLAMAASAALSPGALAGNGAANASETQLITRLRSIRATGRIVLQFTPKSHGVDSVPNIQLENGDRFVVPPVPASVNVVGSVYDQNSFLFRPGIHAGEYLRLAGGPTRSADRKHMFIIRADGSVVSFAAARTLWGNEFEALQMNPGDTIVVPQKIFKPSPMIGILDWTTLFSQFALGAAAIKAVY